MRKNASFSCERTIAHPGEEFLGQLPRGAAALWEGSEEVDRRKLKVEGGGAEERNRITQRHRVCGGSQRSRDARPVNC